VRAATLLPALWHDDLSAGPNRRRLGVGVGPFSGESSSSITVGKRIATGTYENDQAIDLLFYPR
jgi:hypothetical protein